MDGIGDEFEYVRYGGSWPKFLANLQQLREDFDKINFNSTWCILTAFGTLECIDFLQNLGFHENSFIVNPLDYPNQWQIGHLPNETLDQLKQKILTKLQQSDHKYSLYNSLNLMLNYLSIPIEKNLQSTFI